MSELPTALPPEIVTAVIGGEMLSGMPQYRISRFKLNGEQREALRLGSFRDSGNIFFEEITQIILERDGDISPERPGDSHLPSGRLTFVIRDEAPFVILNDMPAYRTVDIELTPEQREALRLHAVNDGDNLAFEHVARLIVEKEAPKPKPKTKLRM